MSSIPTIRNLKRSVTKKIQQTIRRLEKNLENLSKLANPVSEPARIPIPVHDSNSTGPGAMRACECSWQSIIPCLTQLSSAIPKLQMNYNLSGEAHFSAYNSSRAMSNFSRKPGIFPGSALFGSSLSLNIAISIYGTRLATSCVRADLHTIRFYSTYQNFSGGRFSKWRWSNINNSIMFRQFSSRTQFHLQKFLNYYRLPTITQILKKRSRNDYCEWESRVPIWNICRELTTKKPQVNMASVATNKVTSTALRLNALLTQGFHDMVRALATTASTVAEGCYVDFKLQPVVLVPEKTMMNCEVLAELLTNLRQFERYLAQLRRDLAQLSDLGELPVRFVSKEGVIRVYFPNCDIERVQILLREKSVCTGVIHQDFSQDDLELDRFCHLSSVSENSFLSSHYLSLVELNSESSDSNVLSLETSSADFVKHQPGNIQPMHLESVDISESGHIEFVEDSCFMA